MQESFFFEFADEQMLGEGYLQAFLEFWSLQLRNDTKMSPQHKSFFFIVTSTVYVLESESGSGIVTQLVDTRKQPSSHQ